MLSLEGTLVLPGLPGRPYSHAAPQGICLPHMAIVDILELSEKVEESL